MKKSIRFTVSLVVVGSKITVKLKGGNDPVPLNQTPPLSILATSEIDFALVGDAEDSTYHVFVSKGKDSLPNVIDLGSTGHRYDANEPVPPREVEVMVNVKGNALYPSLSKQRPEKLSLAALASTKRQISFGIASNTWYWVACNPVDRRLHLYASNGLGWVQDCGSLGVPC